MSALPDDPTPPNVASPPTTRPAGSGPSPPGDPPSVDSTPRDATDRRLADHLVTFHADMLTDAEALRIATEGRLRSLTSDAEWGQGVNPLLPEVQVIEAHLEQVRALEHGATLALKRALRRHYLAAWQKATVGVGEKQLARLLACIGDPATRDRPSQLWAYCGLHVVPAQITLDTQPCAGGDRRHPDQVACDAQIFSVGVAPARRRGQRANWDTEAKSRVYVVAESCIKQWHSPYRAVYDDGRVKYADAVHRVACVRCGPSGAPAPAGSPLSAGHQHARAMRLVMKRVLLDLWREARQSLPTSGDAVPTRDASGDAPTGQITCGTQSRSAGGGDDHHPTSGATDPRLDSSGGGTPGPQPAGGAT